MIYVDMDGVIADFESAVVGYTGCTIKEHIDAKQWDVVKKTFMSYDVFINLQPMPLIEVLKDHVGKFKILTATGYINQDDVEKAKIEWLCKQIPGFDVDDFIAVAKSHEKGQYASKDSDILIDDRMKSHSHWLKNNGTGMIFKNTEYQISVIRTCFEMMDAGKTDHDILIYLIS